MKKDNFILDLKKKNATVGMLEAFKAMAIKMVCPSLTKDIEIYGGQPGLVSIRHSIIEELVGINKEIMSFTTYHGHGTNDREFNNKGTVEHSVWKLKNPQGIYNYVMVSEATSSSEPYNDKTHVSLMSIKEESDIKQPKFTIAYLNATKSLIKSLNSATLFFYGAKAFPDASVNCSHSETNYCATSVQFIHSETINGKTSHIHLGYILYKDNAQTFYRPPELNMAGLLDMHGKGSLTAAAKLMCFKGNKTGAKYIEKLFANADAYVTEAFATGNTGFFGTKVHQEEVLHISYKCVRLNKLVQQPLTDWKAINGSDLTALDFAEKYIDNGAYDPDEHRYSPNETFIVSSI